MPIIPPSVTAPYNSAQYALNLARVIVNDAGISLAGNLLADSQPYTLTYVNEAWWTLQEKLAINGVETQISETVLNNLTAVTDLDPATQAYIDYQHYFDGETTLDTPVLPQDLILPIRLWERQYGTEQEFIPMNPAQDGLPSRVKSIYLGEWEWRNNKIRLVGATQASDIRIRYQSYLADIAAVANPLPIMRCTLALANYIAASFAMSRGSEQASALFAKGDVAVLRMVSLTTRAKQRGQHRRIPYSRRGNSDWGY